MTFRPRDNRDGDRIPNGIINPWMAVQARHRALVEKQSPSSHPTQQVDFYKWTAATLAVLTVGSVVITLVML
jgi:hypothetical protein